MAKRPRRDTVPDGVVVDTPIDDSDAYTVPRCQECNGEAIPGGPTIPDEQMCRDRWPWCAFGPNWSWCFVEERYKRR